MNDRIKSGAAGDLIAQQIASQRPLVLFLGQSAWTSRREVDPVLSILLDRKGQKDKIVEGWRSLSQINLTSDDLIWLTERFNRHIQSEAMQEVMDLPWSAVFTSSIDPQLQRRFETHARQPECVLARGHFARVPRSRSRPPIYHLFGRSDQVGEELRPPRTPKELAQRRIMHASDMLNRVAETVTPSGLLVVDGYDAERDWLSIDDLLAPLSVAHGLRIVWFGLVSSPQSVFFEDLRLNGTIVTEERRLPDALSELRATGQLGRETTATIPDEPGIVTFSKGAFLDVSAALRLRVEASAAIVDDSWTNQNFSNDLDLAAFERFHGAHGTARTLVEGIGRGFAIERDFEPRLRERVEAALENQEAIGRAIILHGQSGTGKSIFIARLAYLLREQRKTPVLLATSHLPQATDIDEFCAEAERVSGKATAILIDTDQPPHRYRELVTPLKSRGRQFVIVGTSYRRDVNRGRAAADMIEASRHVSPKEYDALRALVNRFHGDFDRLVARVPKSEKDFILPLLYRMLSAGQSRIFSGINLEVRTTSDELRRRSSTVRAAARTALAEELIRAGFHEGTVSFFRDEPSKLGEDAPSRLIDYVMVAGRLDCKLPINLLMRLLMAEDGQLDVEQLYEVFNELDLFRWRSDEEGSELFISPRLQLEAELICRSRLADRERELNYLLELIEAVRPGGVDRTAELEFLLDLLQNLNRDGPRREAYAHGFRRIAESLTLIRTRHRVSDARLMLQESAFRRAALRAHDAGVAGTRSLSEDERAAILNESREVVEHAIQEISEGKLRAGRATRENLLVERASIYGFLAVGQARTHQRGDLIWSNYLATRTAISRALGMAESYFPFDIGLWTPVDILEEEAKAGALTRPQRIEMMADIHAILDQVDISRLPPPQQQRFHERRVNVAQVLKDETMGEDAYQELERLNPPIAYFLRARNMCPDIFDRITEAPRDLTRTGPSLSDGARTEASNAVRFLKQHENAIINDNRCLYLLLQLTWAVHTGDRLLRGFRRPLPADRGALSELLGIVAQLNALAPDGPRFILRYLEATLAWMNNEKPRAFEIWRRLGRDTDLEDPSRIIQRLFVADASGKPVLFRGRLEHERQPGKWQLRVDSVTGYVDLQDTDFRGEDLAVGREIRDFTIGFNYLGPIATPLARYRERR
jgi:hypothetical protein